MALTSRLSTRLALELGPFFGSVASVPPMRWPLAHGSSCRRGNGRRRRAAPLRLQVRGQPRLPGLGRGGVGVSLHLAGPCILDSPARLGGVTVEAVVVHPRAQTAADQAMRLHTQELRPARANPPRGGTKARGAQRGRDRGRGDADPELQQLTPNAHVAPARILSRQSLDQAARLLRKRRATMLARAAYATSLQQRPVPAAKRLWTHRKAGPPLLREQPTGRSEQGAVGGRVPRPLPSSPEDRELVTQDDDLKLPLATVTGEDANNHAQEPVQHAHQHHAQSATPRLRSPPRPSRSNQVSLPHRSNRA